MGSIVTLAAALALGGALLMAADRMMREADHPGRPRRLLATLWIPLCMTVPAIGLVQSGGTHDSLIGSLGPLVVAPIAALLAVPPMLLARMRRGHPDWHADDHVPLAWPAIGVMLLLLAAAGSGPQFLLIVVCAAGLVLVWADSIPRAYEGHGGPGAGWILLSVAIAVGLAVVANQAGPSLATLLILMAVGTGLPIVAAARLGRRTAMLAAGWAAAIGPVLVLATVSQDAVRVALQAVLGGASVVAGYPWIDGLETLAAPGAAVLAFSGVVAGWARAPAGRGRVITIAGWAAAAGAVGALIALY
ncbi:MAG: hypothetical protein QF561_03870 [Phycisphaerales bacterium]|jgi:hypothetical protein|nr:hypothetical protein [Phycisphaerales bacterium]